MESKQQKPSRRKKKSPPLERLQNGILHSDLEAVEAALNGEIDIDAMLPSQGKTGLVLCAQRGFNEGCAMMLDYGADPNLCDEAKCSALFYCLKSGNVEGVKMLLEAGANPFQFEGKLEELEIQSPSCVKVVREAQQGPVLVDAARLGDVVQVMKIAKYGSHVTNYQDEGGWTALHGACYSDNSQIVHILIKHGAKVDSRTCHQYTPLIEACATGKKGACKALLREGADVNAVDADGWSCLHYACAENRVEIVKLLLSVDVNIHLVNDEGKLASDVCVSQEVEEMLKQREEEQREMKRIESMRLRVEKEVKNEMEQTKRMGELSQWVLAEDMLSQSLRENEVLRDTVVQMAEGLSPELLERIANASSNFNNNNHSNTAEEEKKKKQNKIEGNDTEMIRNTQELRRLTSLCCGAMSCLEESGNHVRQMEDSSLEEAFIQFSSIDIPSKESQEVLWQSPYSTVIGARLLGRSVVVKRINVDLDLSQTIHRTIFDDVAVFPALRHPNLVTCLGVAFSPKPEVVFARVDGPTLHSLLHKQGEVDLTLRTKFRIIRGMSDALGFLHLQSVIHGRFSSLHVLLGSDYECKISGFAMTKTMSEVRGNKPVGNWRRWSAPEAAASQNEEVSEWTFSDKCDVYSFGMVCWELCTEIEPFGDIQSEEEVLQRMAKGERPFSTEDFYTIVPSIFSPLLSACLSVEPQMRPSFVSIQNYLKTMLPRLPSSLVRLDESCRRAFLRDLDLFRLALDRGERIESASGIHGMELKARWQWSVQQRSEHVVQRALEFGIPVSCVVVGGVDYELLLKNGVSPSELFELDDLIREPSFCPISFFENSNRVDQSDRILVEVYNDFGQVVGNEILRVFEELHGRGVSRRVVPVAVDPATTMELTPLQVLTCLSRLMRSSTSSLSSHQDELISNANNNDNNVEMEENGVKSKKNGTHLSKTSALMVENFRSQGKHHMAEGRFSEAVGSFAAALFIDPENSELYAKRSAALFGCGCYMQALDDCNVALGGMEGCKDYVPAYSLRLRQADCYLKLGKVTEAEYCYRCLQNENATNEELSNRLLSCKKVRTIIKLGPFLLKQERLQELLKHVTEGLSISPDDDDLLVLQCRALLSLEEGDLALRSAEAVLRRNDYSRGGWLSKGIAMFQHTGNIKVAVQCFDRLEDGSNESVVDEDGDRIHSSILGTTPVTKNTKHLAVVSRENLDLPGNTPFLAGVQLAWNIRCIHNLMVETVDLVENAQYEEACARADDASNRMFGNAPLEAFLYYVKAVCKAKLEANEDALTYFTIALELDPLYLEAYVGRAEVLRKMGNERASNHDFEQMNLLKQRQKK